MMDSLPEEVIMNILSWVPTLDLGNLRYVCRTWRNIIDVKNPLFRTLHLSHSLSKPNENNLLLLKGFYDLHSVDLASHHEITFRMPQPRVHSFWHYVIIGSCNGLLCLGSVEEVKILVMNPITREHVLLPIVSNYVFLWGFGFDFVNKIFKVVVIIHDGFGMASDLIICDLYSHKNLYWRHTGWKETFDFYLWNWKPACFVNGRLHWTAKNDSSVYIVSFDLADEEFRMVPTPDCLCSTRKYDLFVSRGCLCIICSQSSSVRITRLEIWTMKKYGIKESWVKEVDTKPLIPESLSHIDEDQNWRRPLCLEGLGSVRDGEVLLQCETDSRDKAILFSSDPACDQLQLLELRNIPLPSGSVIHTASLNWI